MGGRGHSWIIWPSETWRRQLQRIWTLIIIIWVLSKLLFSHSVVSNTLQPHGLQHARLPCLPLSPSLLKFMFIELVILFNHLILCHPLLLLPSIFPSLRIFSNESAICIRWPKYWSFSFSIKSSSEYSGLISLRIDWFDLLAVQGTRKSLLQPVNQGKGNVREKKKKTLPVLRATASYEDRRVYIFARQVGVRRYLCKEQEDVALKWYLKHSYSQKVFVTYCRFTLNQMSYILSGNSTWKPSLRKWSVFIFFIEGLLLEKSPL